MALTTDEQQELLDLKAALHKARTGQQVKRVMFNGKLTEWVDIDVKDCRDRLQELEAKSVSPTGRARGAIGFRSC